MFFSLNSIALRTFSLLKLQEAFKARHKEQLLESFIENSEKITLACSLIAAIANIAVLALLVLLAVKGHLAVFVVAIVIFTFLSLAVPHSWAKYAGEKILAATHRFLVAVTYIASPVLQLLALHDTLTRRLAGVAQTTPDQQQEELLSVVEQRKMEGVVDAEEMEMIENVLELADTTAEEIMTPRTDIIALKADDDLTVVLETISKAGHSRIPVYQDNIDNIIGLVYAKDLLAEIGKAEQQFKLGDKMRKAYFVPETKPLRALLHEFQNQKLHIAIVLDEYGGTAGIVTIEDILEELVGEIVDEYEETPPKAIKKIDETTIEIDARMYIDDLNSECDLDLPEDEDYDTIGGFVFSHLGYIPKTGEAFDYENVKFTITAAEIRRIKRIKIQKLPTEKNADQ
jgi:CBS domain containing-hemolysin-like protein